MIAGTLQKKIGESMKAHDEIRTSTLRLLLSAFNYERIDKQHELTDEEELVVIRREAKKRKEAIEMYRNAGAEDRAAKEEGGCQTSQASAQRQSIAEWAPRASQAQPRNIHARTSRAACNVGSAYFPNPPLGGDYERSAPGARQSGGTC